MYKPNLQLALASSYNERGISGYTNTITNRIDQQKSNCYYEVTKNSITGAGKLELTKRPGVVIDASNFGSSTQAAYSIISPPAGGIGTTPWVFSTLGNDIDVSDANSTTTIFSSSAAAAFIPAFLDKTLITNIETVVMQATRGTASVLNSQRVFFNSSSIGAAWSEITDGDFTALKHIGKMEFMDGFAFVLDSTNKIYNSDLNSLANWTATNFITKQIKQDLPLGLARLDNQLIALGGETLEVFYNAGNATGSPLSPIKQLHQKVGLADVARPIGSTTYYATVRNKIYFCGRESGGRFSQGFYSYNGSGIEKCSTAAVDKILSEESNLKYGVFSLGFNGQAAIAIQFTAPAAATQRWLMYYPEWKDWFEWNSTVFSPANNGEFFLGVVPNQQRLYSLISQDNWQDSGTNFTMQTQFKLPQDGHQRKRMAEFGVLADTARASNQLLVEFSDDDYQSFYTVGNIELQRDIKTLNRGGSYRQRAVRLSSTNALETRLSAFIARIE